MLTLRKAAPSAMALPNCQSPPESTQAPGLSPVACPLASGDRHLNPVNRNAGSRQPKLVLIPARFPGTARDPSPTLYAHRCAEVRGPRLHRRPINQASPLLGPPFPILRLVTSPTYQSSLHSCLHRPAAPSPDLFAAPYPSSILPNRPGSSPLNLHVHVPTPPFQKLLFFSSGTSSKVYLFIRYRLQILGKIHCYFFFA